MNLSEPGHCYMFKEEFPDCQIFESAKINNSGQFGVSDKPLNKEGGYRKDQVVIFTGGNRSGLSSRVLLSIASLNSLATGSTSDAAIAQSFARKQMYEVPFSPNRRREGKSKKPKKW